MALPAQPASPEAPGSAPSSPGPQGPLRGLLGTLVPSIGTDSSRPDSVSSVEESSSGLLQRARNLKPLDAASKAVERLPGIPSSVPREAGVAVDGNVASAEEDPGSGAASVRDRLGKLVPDRLRRSLDSGPPEGNDMGDGSRQLGAEGRRELLREGEAKAEEALRKLRSKAGEAKEGLAAEDSAVRRMGEKFRGAVGPRAGTAGAAVGGQAAGPTVACKDGAAAAMASSDATDEAAGKGLRGLAKRLKGATQAEAGGEMERGSQGAHQGCSDVPSGTAAAVGEPDESSAVLAEKQGAGDVSEKQVGEGSAAVVDRGALSVLAMIPSWLMFW